MPTKRRKKKAPAEELVLQHPDGTEPAVPAVPIINEDFSYISPKDGKTYSMTLKEKVFCEAYLTFYGNGVDAVYEAGYKVKDRKIAAQVAHDNLRKPNLMAYIDSLLVEYGFSDDNVEKQHLYVMNQFDDLQAKNKAIEMFYKLRSKFPAEKHDVRVVNVTELIKAKLGLSGSVPSANTE